jgi:alpha-1,2-mannosyltransferase
MNASARQRLIIITSVFGFCGLLAWSFYALTFAFAHRSGQDWMVFYTAARAYFDGNLPLIFDGERFTAALNARFVDWLASPLSLHPWINPPIFLLLILPFGLLPFGLSYALFEVAIFAFLLAALPLYAKDRKRWLLLAFALAISPAAGLTVGVGQNSFLSGALLVAGFGLLDRRPVLAGMLLGVLAYKPQFCLMIPIALLAGQHWRALAGAALSGSLLVLASAALFGVEPWRVWLEFAAGTSDFYRDWVATSRIMGQSVYACVVKLGAPATFAMVAQGGAAIFAAGSVYWCFRRKMRAELRLAVLLVATLLAAPHVSWSDELLATIAALLLLGVALDEGFRSGDALLVVLVWLSAFVSPQNIFAIGRLIPFLLCFFIVWVIMRTRPLSHQRSGAAFQPTSP